MFDTPVLGQFLLDFVRVKINVSPRPSTFTYPIFEKSDFWPNYPFKLKLKFRFFTTQSSKLNTVNFCLTSLFSHFSFFFQIAVTASIRTKELALYMTTSYPSLTHRQHRTVSPIPPLHPSLKEQWYDKVRYNTQDLECSRHVGFKEGRRSDRIVVFGWELTYRRIVLTQVMFGRFVLR